MKSLVLTTILTIILILAYPIPVNADGIIIPFPPLCDRDPCPTPPPDIPLPGVSQLTIKYHHVTVQIRHPIATTHIKQVFYNPNDWQVEGIYVFPIPTDATIDKFVMWVDGQPVEGKILSADEARSLYEETVVNLRDPALLEYAERGAIRANLFPILPQQEREIEIEYTQVLSTENDLVKYVYPLNTERFSQEPLEDIRISIDLKSDQSLRTIYSSTHHVDIHKDTSGHASISYEASDLKPDTDFTLFYSLGDTPAAHVLSYRNPQNQSDPDGFFLLLLAPSPKTDQRTIAKDVFLVLDRSGSMEGEKFQQAQTALKYILNHLNPEDRFFISTFSDTINTFSSQPTETGAIPDAIQWIDTLDAAGSTDINRALLEVLGLAGHEKPTYVIFLTDGLPTEGIIDRDEILNNISKTATDNIRLFSFGVGYDVDTVFLDTLGQEHHGLSYYVQPQEKLDEALSTFYTHISSPVLTDIQLDFGELITYDVYPQPLPDLFAEGQIIVTGRYKNGGLVDITLSGKIDAETTQYQFPEQNFATTGTENSDLSAELTRLWATRKIGYLLNQIRLKGTNKEYIDQIVKLSIRYGIMTPYTSFLINEEMPLGNEAQETIIENTYRDMLSQPAPEVSGEMAVQKAAGEGALSQAIIAPSTSVEDSQTIKHSGNRTFLLEDGVWIDTGFDPQTMTPTQVKFLSTEYFRLSRSTPDIASAMAIGERVIFVSGAQSYEITEQDPLQMVVSIPTPEFSLETEIFPTITPHPVTGKPTAQIPVNETNSFLNWNILPWLLAGVGIVSLAYYMVLRKK